MSEQEFPTLNDVAPSWADLTVSIPVYGGVAVKTADIVGITWEETVEVGAVRGLSGGRKRKRTRGQYDCSASLTMLRQGYRTLAAALTARAKALGVGLSLIGFDIVLLHTTPELTGDSEVHEVKIEGCRMTGRSGDMAEGTDADQIETTVDCMRILVDGIPLL